MLLLNQLFVFGNVATRKQTLFYHMVYCEGISCGRLLYSMIEEY
jgi:hypothetical protein